jgi:hypothetical protein
MSAGWPLIKSSNNAIPPGKPTSIGLAANFQPV